MEEIWKDIEGYDGLYQVSSMGNVKSLARVAKSGKWGKQTVKEKLLKQFVGQGHCRVRLMKDGIRNDVFVHRLVANVFLGCDIEFNGNNLVCHKNDVGTDNRVENLYIGTYSDNNKDTVRNGHGVDNCNEKHGMCKLTNKEIKKIRKLISDGVNQYKIAKMYGINQSYVSRLKNDLNRRNIKYEL